MGIQRQSSMSVNKEFTDIPQRIYADDPFWLGEDSSLIQQEFSIRNGFFETGEAWIGYEGDTRLAAFFESGYRLEDQPAACFGYWETNQNLKANRSLFSKVEKWAKAKGVKALYGPINFSTFGAYRLRVNAFDESAFLGEPYNPHYYPDLLVKLGFEVCQRYQSRFHHDIAQWACQVRPKQKELSEKLGHNFLLQPLSVEMWLKYLPQAYRLVETAFKRNFAFRSIPFAEFRKIFGESYIAKSCPVTSQIVLDRDNHLAGFFVCFPDYAELISSQARLQSSLDLRYTTHFPKLNRPRTLLAKTGAVDPKYRGKGIFTWMCNQLVIASVRDYQQVCAALMREDNLSMNYGLNFPTSRNYALFRKKLI